MRVTRREAVLCESHLSRTPSPHIGLCPSQGFTLPCHARDVREASSGVELTLYSSFGLYSNMPASDVTHRQLSCLPPSYVCSRIIFI